LADSRIIKGENSVATPAIYRSSIIRGRAYLFTLFTALFLHSDILHLIFNMWMLLIFGRNVECSLGHVRFVVFMLRAVSVGSCSISPLIRNPSWPCVEASGALAGVMGAYIAVHPLNKIKVWVVFVLEIPAYLIICHWFVLQYILGFLTLKTDALGGGIPFWNYLGGFAAGIVIV